MKKILAAVLLALTVAFAVMPAQAVPHQRRHHQAVKHAQGVTVWVNTKTGVYHFPGERWYGHTAQGEYITEAQAKAAGYRPTENGQ